MAEAPLNWNAPPVPVVIAPVCEPDDALIEILPFAFVPVDVNAPLTATVAP